MAIAYDLCFLNIASFEIQDKKLHNQSVFDQQNITLNEEEKAIALAINGYFRQEMIEVRNKRMATKVIDLMNQNPDTPFFFAFGTFHFVGTNNTIVDYVKAAGFNVTRIGPNDILPELEILNSSVTRAHFDKISLVITIYLVGFFGHRF